MVCLLLDRWFSAVRGFTSRVTDSVYYFRAPGGPFLSELSLYNDEEEGGGSDWCLVTPQLTFKEDFSVFGKKKNPPPSSVPDSIPFRSVLTLLIGLMMNVTQETGAVELVVVEFTFQTSCCSVISLLFLFIVTCEDYLAKHARAEEMQKKKGENGF